MSLLEKLEHEQEKASSSACKVGNLFIGDKLSDKEKTQLLVILNTPETDPTRVPNNALAKVLREEGYDISNSAVDRHRRKDCSCTRKANA